MALRRLVAIPVGNSSPVFEQQSNGAIIPSLEIDDVTGQIYAAGAAIGGGGGGGSFPTLDQILDPTADKTFAMGGHVLEFDECEIVISGKGVGNFDGEHALLALGTDSNSNAVFNVVFYDKAAPSRFAAINAFQSGDFAIYADEAVSGGSLGWNASASLWRFGGNLQADNALQINGDVGFFSTTPAAKQTVSGSKGANAALASLLTALAAYGLITDSTS
jgi:hypothetical protein